MKSFCIQSSFKNKPTRYSHCLALEARLVFDGAVVATAVEAQNTANESNPQQVSAEAVASSEPTTVDFLPPTTAQSVDYSPNVDATSHQSEFFTAVNLMDSAFVPKASTEQTSAIIVVDPRADNAALLYLNPPVNTQVMVLDAARDGFQQVAELLQTRQDVTELHILPWTQDHQQWLGSQSLTATLEPSASSRLMDWNDGLADNAELVFHGQESMGAGWLNHLSALTNTQTSWSVDSFNQDNNTPSLNSSSATSIVFIDGAVQNTTDIVSALDKNAEIVYLDANQDGLTQIADYLTGRSGIDSIQIISHSNEAALHLGNNILTNDNLTSHATELAAIGHSLTASGDILLYGCDLAKSTDGSAFVDSFSYLTQADVAASTDLTGAASKGGNWTLEYTAGTIEATILAASHYQDILALPVYVVPAGQALQFGSNDPLVRPVTVVRGTTGQAAGDIILFNNVITIGGQAIDALVTVVANNNINILNLDTANGAPIIPATRSRDPNFFELITAVTAIGGNSTIKFQFIQSGTYNSITGTGVDVLLQNVIVNSYDVDETQFQDFSGFSGYTLASNSTLTTAGNGGFTRFYDTTNPPVDNQASADPASPNYDLATFNQARITAYYNEINTFQIDTGSNLVTNAYFYLDFSGGPAWTSPVTKTYDIPTAAPLTTHIFTPTLTGTYQPNVTGSLTDSAQSLTVVVNGVTYSSTNGSVPTNGLTWSNGTWSLTIPPANPIAPGTYNVVVDTGYGTSVNNIDVHTKDNTVSELVVINDPPVNTVPAGPQYVRSGVAERIPLSVTDVNGNLASTRLTTLTGGILNVSAIPGGATIIGNNSGDLTLTGTEAQIKAILDTLTYIGTSNDTLTITSTDNIETTTNTVDIKLNTPPLAINDNAIGIIGSPVIINVLNNDSDPENNLDPTTVKIVGAAPDGTLTVPNEGTWSVDINTGAITFTPIAGFTGNPAPINYTVKDNAGLVSAAATVTVTMNKLPVAIADNNTAIEGGATITGDIISNEFTLGDQPTVVTAASQGVRSINIASTFITAAGGILILNADGSYSYTPPRSVAINGLIERFNYTITDANGDTSSSILTIVVRTRLGTSGSLIQLSNPQIPVADNLSNFFAPSSVTSIDLSLYDTSTYIPSLNDIISLTGSLRDQVVLELKFFSFDIPSWSFRHTNPNEQLDFEASRPDGSSLPDWLRFNPKLLRFSGIPPKGVHNETVMVTARDSYGNEVHALFTVHVNKEQARSEHKSLNLDLKLMGIPDKAIEKHPSKEKPATVGKSGLSERLHAVGKLGKLQQGHELLNSLKRK